MRGILKRVVRKVDRWLGAEPEGSPRSAPPPMPSFDNNYEWLSAAFAQVMSDPRCSSRQHYIWGVLQGAAFAKVLGLERISVIELGVAAGAGLIALEHIAQECEKQVGIAIDVVGFDTGTGYPKPADYRDMPYRWSEGFYPCDKAELKKRLSRAQMLYGLVDKTLGDWIASKPARLAFSGFDLGLYSSTHDALKLLFADDRFLLPRTPCTFRCSIPGRDNCQYTGELLAISEFNGSHDDRKICKMEAMHYSLPPQFDGHWTEMLYLVHSFHHPLYAAPQSYSQSAIIDPSGREIFVAAKADSRLNSESP